jgi:RND family efflux transporter MFP subunit
MQVTLDILHNLGMDDRQIKELEASRKFSDNIILYAPATGFVEVRNVAPELRFQKGAELYRIVDLSRVWILADVFESEAENLKPGLTVRAVNKQLGRPFSARVSEVLPRFDPSTRTLKVRLEADNPDFALKPDMFLDIDYSLDLPASLAVPAEAVLDTGMSKSVFVALDGGYFEARKVETGWRHGKLVEITAGLKEGERIVISGNFLLDSESRLKDAAKGLHDNAVEDPVCHMKIDPAKAGDRKSVVGDKTFYFCSADCKHAFDSRPLQDADRSLH